MQKQGIYVLYVLTYRPPGRYCILDIAAEWPVRVPRAVLAAAAWAAAPRRPRGPPADFREGQTQGSSHEPG